MGEPWSLDNGVLNILKPFRRAAPGRVPSQPAGLWRIDLGAVDEPIEILGHRRACGWSVWLGVRCIRRKVLHKGRTK